MTTSGWDSSISQVGGGRARGGRTTAGTLLNMSAITLVMENAGLTEC